MGGVGRGIGGRGYVGFVRVALLMMASYAWLLWCVIIIWGIMIIECVRDGGLGLKANEVNVIGFDLGI